KAENAHRHAAAILVDGRIEKSEQRISRCLNIVREDPVGITSGNEDVRTDNLGGIAGADTQKFGRFDSQPDDGSKQDGKQNTTCKLQNSPHTAPSQIWLHPIISGQVGTAAMHTRRIARIDPGIDPTGCRTAHRETGCQKITAGWRFPIDHFPGNENTGKLPPPKANSAASEVITSTPFG